jgi:Glycoside hydrolase 123, catalytic domain
LVLFGNFISFSSSFWEIWIVQTAWYIRKNGLYIGLYLGFLGYNAIPTLAKILKDTQEISQKNQKILVSGFFGLISINLSIFNILYLPYGLFYILIYSILIQATCAIVHLKSFIQNGQLIEEKDTDGFTEDEKIENDENINDNGSDEEKESKSDKVKEEKMSTSKKIEVPYGKGNLKLPHNQNNNLQTMINNKKWFSFFLLLQLLMWGYIFFEYPLNAENSIIFIIPVAAGSLLISYWSIAIRTKRKYISEKPAILDEQDLSIRKSIQSEKRIAWFKEQFVSAFIVIFDIARITLVIVCIALISYTFPEWFMFPDFQANLWQYAILGCLLFIGLRKKNSLQKICYAFLLLALTYLIFAINQDVILNLFSYYNGTFETIYPFQVLLSPLHAIIVGLATGYIFSYELYRLFTRVIDDSNTSIRAFSIIILFFLFGMAVGGFSDTPVLGGQIAWNSYVAKRDGWTQDPFLESSYSGFFITLMVLILIWFIMDVIIPLFNKKTKVGKEDVDNGKNPDNPENFENSEEFDTNGKDSKGKSNNPYKKRKKRYVLIKPSKIRITALALMILIVVPIGITFSVNPGIKDAYKLPLVSSKQGVDVFIAPSYLRIGPDQMIMGASATPISHYNISMAKNEYESVQVIISPDKRALNGLSCSISDFKRGSNSIDVIGKNNITVRYVENVIDEQFPDKLVPLTTANCHLTEQRNHIFWITVYVPRNVKAGSYVGNIIFRFGNSENITVPLSLDVWNFNVPTLRHLRSNYGPQTSNQEHSDTFMSHRINSYGIPISRAPKLEYLNTTPEYTCFLNETTNEWTFDWTWWDTMTEKNIQNGANGFYMNCPLGMPREPIWFEDDGVNRSVWGTRTAACYKGFQDHLMDKLVNESKNWFRYSYIYFIDEFQMFVPDGYEAEEYWKLLEGFLDLINSSAPDIKIMTTSPPTQDLKGISKYIDIYCPITSDYNVKEWGAAMADGKEMWMYPCVGPRSPWPNSHFYNPLYEIRTLYWQAFYYKIHGFLYWSTSAYYHGSYGMAYNSWGDGWFVYMDKDNHVYDSIRWENWRDANEDYEYLWLMNATITSLGGDYTTTAKLNNMVQEVSKDHYNICDSGDVVINNRNYIGNWLSTTQTSGVVNTTAIGLLDWNPP